MKQSVFIKVLRSLVREFYHEDGSVGTQIDSFGGYSLSVNSKKVLEELVKLVIKTAYFEDEVKDYLQGATIEQLREKYKGINMEKINASTLMSRIFYQINNLKKVLGEDALNQILYTKSDEVLKLYYKKIKTLEQETKSKSLLDNMTFKVPSYSGEVVEELEEEDLDLLCELIIHYSKQGRRIVARAFTSEMVGYVHYLEGKHVDRTLTKEEAEIFDMMKRYLG